MYIIIISTSYILYKNHFRINDWEYYKSMCQKYKSIYNCVERRISTWIQNITILFVLYHRVRNSCEKSDNLHNIYFFPSSLPNYKTILYKQLAN